MSKYVKNLITDHLRDQLKEVGDALLVNVVGLKANANNRLRSQLKAKNIRLIVVKNSLAARAVAGTTLAPLFDGVSGSTAICWGSEDIVALAKEITRLVKSDQFGPLEARGGVMEGARLTREQVQQVEAKFPELGRYLRAPCWVRSQAHESPFCPEGDRFCGVPVWKKPVEQYARII